MPLKTLIPWSTAPRTLPAVVVARGAVSTAKIGKVKAEKNARMRRFMFAARRRQRSKDSDFGVRRLVAALSSPCGGRKCGGRFYIATKGKKRRQVAALQTQT